MATVLVVDDEPVICELVAEVLQREGYSVFTAPCGSQALSMFRSHREIDLLISDIRMPEMDGLTLAKKLRAERPGLSVLLMSGCCENGQVSKCFDFLPKPFSIAELADRVHQLVRTCQAA